MAVRWGGAGGCCPTPDCCALRAERLVAALGVPRTESLSELEVELFPLSLSSPPSLSIISPSSRGGARRGQPALGGNHGDPGLETLREPRGIDNCRGTLYHRDKQRCVQLAPKAGCEVLRLLAILTGAFEEETEAVFLHQPLLQLDRARAELAVGGQQHGQHQGATGRQPSRNCFSAIAARRA